jgi:hypothetical protein
MESTGDQALAYAPIYTMFRRCTTYTLPSKAIALDLEFAHTLQPADSSLDRVFVVLQQ